MLNTAILMGRLTSEPELRQTANGSAVTSFTLACDRSYVKAGADRQVDFIDIVAWRNTAEFVSRYFRKGQLVAVQGSIQTRSYTDKQGNKRKAFEIVADNVHFAEPKRDGQPAGGDPSTGYQPSGGYQQNDFAIPPSPRAAVSKAPDVAYDDGYADQTQFNTPLSSDDDLPS